MRVAVIGVSHWHVPMYLEYLAQIDDVAVVAVSDPSDEAVARARAIFPAARPYRHWGDLLDREDPDLIMAHAPHDEMTALAAKLVEKATPFHMEKPMGLDPDALARVADRARSKGLFISVPLVTRLFGVASKLLELASAGRLGDVAYYYFRLLAPGPQRYREMGVAWMLDPAKAGDGPLYNFGPHGIDLFIAFAGMPSSVFATATFNLHRLEIPDVVSLVMRTDGGAYGVCELSYSSPEDYDRHLIVRSPTVAYSGRPDVGEIWLSDGQRLEVGGPGSDEAYRLYTYDLVARVRDGRPPLVGIDQMAAILHVLDAASRSLRIGQPVAVGS